MTTFVVLPQPLFLLPEYAGRTHPAPEVLAACRAALASVLPGTTEILVVSGDGTAGERVAQALLLDAGFTASVLSAAVGPATPPADCADLGAALAGGLGAGTVVLVMADGTARRGPRAPGYVDERAFGVDDAWVAAVRSGSPGALSSLDPEVAAELLFAGRAPLQVLAGLAAGVASAEVLYAGDPFGVQYVVAIWR